MADYNVQQCPNCGTRVVAKADGTCPACQRAIYTLESPPEVPTITPDHPTPDLPRSNIEHAPDTSSKGSKTPSVVGTLIALAIFGVCVGVYIANYRAEHQSKSLLRDLKVFALRYHEFHDAHGRSPGSLAEFESFTPGNTGMSPEFYRVPRAIELIREGRFVVIWDAVLMKDGEQSEGYVLGYMQNASEQGGLVMRGGGSVRTMTAQEFNKMPKLTSKDSG